MSDSVSFNGSDYPKAGFEQKAFEQMLEGRGMSLKTILRLGMTSLLDPARMMLNQMPGPAGYGLRRFIYKYKFKSMGQGCILDVGLRIFGPENISVGDYTWLDAYAAIHGLFGDINIGKRIHVSPFCVLNTGPQGLILEDYVGLSTGVHVYGHTEAPRDGKRMSGPMIPWRYKAFKSAKTTLKKDSFVGAYSIVMPGVTIGEGAVVGASSIVTKDIPDWAIAVGTPAKIVGTRDKVTVPEL